MSGPVRPAESVLVTAPFRRDAAVLVKSLTANGIAAETCADAAALAARLDEVALGLVLTQEALEPQYVRVLADFLGAQPIWSELPIVVLVDASKQEPALSARMRQMLPRARLTVLTRPLKLSELVTTVESALAARRHQWQVRDDMALQSELQRELNHRVKNMLAIVQSIYRMTRRESTSLGEFGTAFEQRLDALARVHVGLGVSQESRLLADTLTMVLAPHMTDRQGRIRLDGEPVALSSRCAFSLSLCFFELATNAVKYGSLQGDAGHILIEWRRDADPAGGLVLRWVERDGPQVAAPDHAGYGTRFLRATLESALGGRIDFDYQPQGLVCEMVIPGDRLDVDVAVDAR